MTGPGQISAWKRSNRPGNSGAKVAHSPTFSETWKPGMARYTVISSPIADQQLAEIWLTAPDRDAVTRATAIAERRLAANADQIGESREDGTRVFFVPPLTVYFEVNEQDKVVE